MNKNTFSLLSSNWMLSQSSKTALLPFLLSIIKGQPIANESLSPTVFSFYNKEKGFQSLVDFNANTTNDNAVAIVAIHHPIFKYDQTCGPKGTQTIINELRTLENNPRIKGVVLHFNSGGGQASGNAEFFDFIKEYSKPVVSFTKDIIGSAAYYMAAASDAIIAHEHADFIGSIGTMFSKIDINAALEQKGVKVIEEYSDLSPEKNKLSRTLKEGDTTVLIKEYLNPLAEKFHNAVKSTRVNITEKALKGDVFNPEQALQEGLIDTIGTLQDAINKVLELATENTNVNTNVKTQTMENYKAIEEVIGATFEEGDNTNGLFLTEAQMDALENKIGGIREAIEIATAPLNEKITELESSVATAQTNSENLTNAITAALETAGIEEELSNEEAVTALANKVVEYGKFDGSAHTKVVDDANQEQQTKNNIVGGIDITAAMNN